MEHTWEKTPARNHSHIKHVSLDVWNTLVTTNPYFHAARIEAIAVIMNCTTERATQMYETVKQIIDSDRHGQDLSIHGVYRLLVDQKYRDDDRNLKIAKKMALIKTIQRLFVLYPPLLTEEAVVTVKYLRHLNITVSIGSNTTFVSGVWMHQFLQARFKHALAFGVYSDIVEHMKPNAGFYDQVYRRIADPTGGVAHPCVAKNVLHVGDKPKEDFLGASSFGFQALIITKPELLFRAVHNTLEVCNA